MIDTNQNHKHIYDAKGKATCCSLEEKINASEEHSHSHNENQEHGHDSRSFWVEYLPVIISFLMLIIGIILEHFIKVSFFQGAFGLIWYIIAYIPVGLPVMKEAVKSIYKGAFFSEFFLMSMATIGAFAINQYPEGVAVMLFYAIGEIFQTAAVKRAKRNIKALLDIRPEIVTVIRNGETKIISPSEILIGETIQVKPGEKVALDGELISPSSSFNTAALTGESKPDTKRSGEKVLAGMINLNTLADIKVTALFKDSKLSKILEMVQDATIRKSQTQIFISKFAKIYTPIVLFLAIVLAILPIFFVRDYVFSDWLYRALIFLVISCPCALVISVPLGYFGGIGLASRNGILFKGSNFLDVITLVDTVVMDKTGTLTKGVFKVQKIFVQDFDENLMIKLTAALESKSTHPVANAIVEYAVNDFKNLKIENVEEIAGHGIKGNIDGFEILAGNQKMLDKFDVKYNFNSNEITDTVVFIAVNNKFVGYITIADEIKEDAKQTIEQLHKLNIKTIMLSGDKQSVVDKVAKTLGIDSAFGDLLPEHKVQKLQELKNQNSKIAFVGDGVNDAPVVALADAGIAMGGLGSDATIEIADIVIQNDQPSKIPIAIRIGKETRKIVLQNITLAFSVKLIVLILGAGKLATLWEAVFADVGVALFAILNATRIQSIKFAATTILLLLCFFNTTFTQENANKPLTLEDAIKFALKNNPQLKSNLLEVEQQKALKIAANDLPKTKLSLINGKNNSIFTDNYWAISQEFQFPTIYHQQGKVQKQNIALSEKNLAVTQNQLIRNIKSVYYQLSFINEKLNLLANQDSIYKNFAEKAELKLKTGESSYLEMISAKNKYQEILLEKKQAEADAKINEQELQKLLNAQQPVVIEKNKLEKLVFAIKAENSGAKQNPLLAYYYQKISIANSQVSLEKKMFLPDLSIGYFNQPSDDTQGFQLEISIPLFFRAQQGKVQAAKIQTKIAQKEYENYQNELKATFNQALLEYQKYADSMNYYEGTGLQQADEILKVAVLSYQKGEIGYVEYIQNLDQANRIKTQFLEYLNQYNQAIININYLIGEK